VNKSLIQSLEYQIEQIKSKLKMNNVLSPITGKIVKVKSSNYDANGNLMDIENIIKVVDMSRLLVVLPVEYYEIRELKIGGKVNFILGGKKVQGEIIDIDNSIQMLKRREVVFITVEIKENAGELMLNQIVDAEIECSIVSLKDYFLKLFNTVTEN